MKGEKAAVSSTKVSGSSTMSDFFRLGSVEDRKAIYQIAAREAIDEQKNVIRSAKNGDFTQREM